MVPEYKRFLTDRLKLPNDIQDIKVPLNVTSSNYHFNNSISKLYDNYEYLLNNSRILYNFYIESNENNLVYNLNNSGNLEPNSVSNLNNITLPNISVTYNHIYTHVGKINNVERYMYVLSKPTELDIFIGDDQFSGELSPDTMVKTNNFTKIKNLGNYNFSNISGITINSHKHLFVCDSGLKLLIKYDLNDIFNLNTSVTPQKVLEIYNGDRDSENVIDFSPSIIDVQTTTDDLLVYDTYSNSIIILDLNLNERLKFSIDNENIEVADVKFGSDSNIYILHTNGYLLRYTLYGEKIDGGFMRDPLQQQNNLEVYKKISFSDNIEGAFYILTNLSVFRKYIQRFGESVGSFLLPTVISYTLIGGKNSTMGGELSATAATVNLNTFAVGVKNIVETNYVDITLSNNGKIYILGNNLLLAISDVETFITLYDTNNLQYSIPLNDIKVSDDELDQEFVFNWSIQKLIYNIYNLYHSIDQKAILDYTEIGEEIFYNTQTVIKPEMPDNNNLEIGLNEIWSSAVFNRVLENVYSTQQKVLNILEIEKLDKPPVTLII